MSDRNGASQLQIGDLQKQKIVFETKEEQYKEKLNINRFENTQVNTTKQLNPVMKHTEIPVYQAALLNMEQLKQNQAVAEHAEQLGNKELERRAQDYSLYDLSDMSFEELAVWATHHAREKGDDRGQFGPIAEAMTHILSLHKILENESFFNVRNMNLNDMYGQAAEEINTAVERYKGSHSAKPWFKKGKLRAHFCNLVSRSLVDNIKMELESKAITIYNGRMNEANKFIKEKSGLDSNSDRALKLADRHFNMINHMEDKEGNPVEIGPKAAILISKSTDKSMLYAHYNLSAEIPELKKIMTNTVDGYDRLFALKPVKFDPVFGTVLPEYKENDKWNLGYINALFDGSYETMRPYLEDMFNVIADTDIRDLMDSERWLNGDYFLENLDRIMHFQDVVLCFQSVILNMDNYKQFNDELKKHDLFDVFEKVGEFLATYLSGVIEYAHAEEFGVTPIGLKTANEVKNYSKSIEEIKEVTNTQLKDVMNSGYLFIQIFQRSNKRFKGTKG